MPRRKRTFIFTRYPPVCHLQVARSGKLKNGAVRLYYALLAVAYQERFLERAIKSALKDGFAGLSERTAVESYNALLSFGYVRERKGREFVEVELVPEGRGYRDDREKI